VCAWAERFALMSLSSLLIDKLVSMYVTSGGGMTEDFFMRESFINIQESYIEVIQLLKRLPVTSAYDVGRIGLGYPHLTSTYIVRGRVPHYFNILLNSKSTSDSSKKNYH
jgi:hypothetical protein